MDYREKKVLVVGMARSGVAVAQLLREHGARVTVNDAKCASEIGESAQRLEKLPDINCRFGCAAAECLDGQEVLVISPGISVNAPFVQKALQMGIHVTGELEVASQLGKGELLAVTGTNGKTTTVSLLGEIFANAGKETHVVGNIGYPYSQAARNSKETDVFVCEVSSFQMETAESFHPHVALLTNITEDHLNRHGTMDVYIDMKMRMFQNMEPTDFAVFNADDPGSSTLSKRVKAHVLSFSRLKPVQEGAFVRDSKVVFRMEDTETIICGVEEIRIPGPHNLENALGAVCMAAVMNVPVSVIRHSLKTFPGVEHRIETVRELDGVVYINDSKGTNVDSTIKAVQTMTKPSVIILGGYDKHCSFDPLSKEMLLRQDMIRCAVLMGATANQIEESLKKTGYRQIYRAKDLQDAVDKSRNLAAEGWNVLFSPACASFDMFSDYEARGRIFKEIVNQLQ